MQVPVRPVLFMLALVVSATVLRASDPPQVGSWKLNPAKSDFGETTVTYEQMADGRMKVTADGQSYTFKTDGKEYPTPWGSTSAWRTLDANTWEVTNKANEKVVGTAALKLAADGKTLTADARNMKATGEATLTFVEEKATCIAKFDGKDHAAAGPIWPSGWTCAIAKSDGTGLDVTWKREGQVMYKDTLTPSADGKTLVDVGAAPKTTEKARAVYDRL